MSRVVLTTRARPAAVDSPALARRNAPGACLPPVRLFGSVPHSEASGCAHDVIGVATSSAEGGQALLATLGCLRPPRESVAVPGDLCAPVRTPHPGTKRVDGDATALSRIADRMGEADVIGPVGATGSPRERVAIGRWRPPRLRGDAAAFEVRAPVRAQAGGHRARELDHSTLSCRPHQHGRTREIPQGRRELQSVHPSQFTAAEEAVIDVIAAAQAVT